MASRKTIKFEGRIYYSSTAAALLLDTNASKIKKLISEEGWEWVKKSATGPLYILAEDIDKYMGVEPSRELDPTTTASQHQAPTSQTQHQMMADPASITVNREDFIRALAVLDTIPELKNKDWYRRLQRFTGQQFID